MGVPLEQALKLPFIAGSMFFARIQAILPLLNLALPSSEFEEEKSQTDGTLAHAIERSFAVSLFSSRMKLFNTKTVQGDANPVSVTGDYPFTK